MSKSILLLSFSFEVYASHFTYKSYEVTWNRWILTNRVLNGSSAYHRTRIWSIRSSRNVPRSTGTYLCALIDWGVGRLCSHGTMSQGLTLCPPWIRGGETPHVNPVGQRGFPWGVSPPLLHGGHNVRPWDIIPWEHSLPTPKSIMAHK